MQHASSTEKNVFVFQIVTCLYSIQVTKNVTNYRQCVTKIVTLTNLCDLTYTHDMKGCPQKIVGCGGPLSEPGSVPCRQCIEAFWDMVATHEIDAKRLQKRIRSLPDETRYRDLARSIFVVHTAVRSR